jgi:Lhr-like helicase
MFEQDLRKWAILDNKIRASNAEIKGLRNERDQLSTTICNTMKTNGWQNKINTGDSIITYCEKNETSSLTFTYLEKCLAEIIPEKEKVQYIIKYLKEKREVKRTTELRRVFNKNKDTSGYETD